MAIVQVVIMLVNESVNAKKGSTVTISCNPKTFTYTLTCDASNFVFSTDELEQGETYTVSLDGSQVCEITLSDTLTAYGNVSMSGQPGGMRGQPGGNMNGGQPGNMGGMQPPDRIIGQGR